MGQESNTKGKTKNSERVEEDQEEIIPTCPTCKKIMLLCECEETDLKK